MELNRLLYEKSVSYKGHLIIPFVFSIANGQEIYSYHLLSELGYRGEFHKLNNPADIYSNSLQNIIEVAKEHLDQNSDITSYVDYFKNRYTYRNNLIIIYAVNDKYFYDHYAPNNLTNIAAPKLFDSEQDCISWVKHGLDRSNIDKEIKNL